MYNFYTSSTAIDFLAFFVVDVLVVRVVFSFTGVSSFSLSDSESEKSDKSKSENSSICFPLSLLFTIPKYKS